MTIYQIEDDKITAIRETSFAERGLKENTEGFLVKKTRFFI